MRHPANAAPAEPSAAELDVWCALVERRCGLDFRGRPSALRRCLEERRERLGAPSCSDYYHYVVFHRDGAGEWAELLREEPPPEGRVVRMWSAGCSVGMEPYSMAIAFLETPGTAGWRARVLGTDLGRRNLERARQGLYHDFEARSLPAALRARYLAPVGEGRSPSYRVADRVRALVTFGPFNLIDPDSYPPDYQDVIFCQNVLLYHPPERRPELIGHLAGRLKAGGYLFLAPAEVVGLRLPGIEPAPLENALAFRRVS